MDHRPLPLPLSAKARRTEDSPINGLIAAKLANPALINFAAGLVDDQSLPVEICGRIARDLFADPALGRRALQYGTTLGLRPLREALLAHFEALEGRSAASMGLTADHILASTGSQQSLYIIADVLLDPGDIVITPNPSYFVFTGALQSLGASVISVPTDEQGMIVDEVDRALARIESRGQIDRVKFIYCTSFFDNPTGLTLGESRRRQLVETARKFSASHRILILEDAAYRELRYDGPALPSIKSFDPDNLFTIITQTFSKPFAPGIKLGYTAMPGDLLDHVLRQKGSHDFGSANLSQEIALAALRQKHYPVHLEALKDRYRQKRNAMLRALEQHLAPGDDLHWTRPNGGLYVWLTLPKHIDTSREGKLFERCIKEGVLFVPGAYSFHPDADGHIPSHHIRLCYGQVPLEEIEPGIERLSRAIGELL